MPPRASKTARATAHRLRPMEKAQRFMLRLLDAPLPRRPRLHKQFVGLANGSRGATAQRPPGHGPASQLRRICVRRFEEQLARLISRQSARLRQYSGELRWSSARFAIARKPLPAWDCQARSGSSSLAWRRSTGSSPKSSPTPNREP
jgi:hypothetical protein